MKLKKILKWIGGIVLTVLLERLFSLIPFEKMFTSEKLNWIIQDRFNWIDFVIFVVLLAVVFIVITVFESKKDDKQKARIKKQLEKNNTIIDQANGIKITWEVALPSMYNPNLHPYNIHIFCTKHEIPLLMQHGRCSDLQCPNSHVQYDESKIRNTIESILLNEQEKLMKK